MVISLYRFVLKSRREEETEITIPETSEYEPFNFEDFEDAKDRYRALAERFDLLAGYHTPEVLQICTEALEYAEHGIWEIERMKRDARPALDIKDPQRRNRIERHFVENSSFQYILSDIFVKLDRTFELLAEHKEEGAYPVLPEFEVVSQVCNLDLTIRNYFDGREAEDQMRKKIIDEIKKAGISDEAAQFLTTNELMQQIILVSPPQKQAV